MRWLLDLPAGLVSDDTSLTAENRWLDGSNIRFWRGQPQVIGGWESLTADTIEGVCRTVFAWSGLDSNVSIGFGTHSHLMVWVGGELADITPVGLLAGQIDGTGGSGYGTGGYGIGGYGEPSTTEYFPRTWALDAWGTDLVASPRNGGLYHWNGNLGAAATVVPNAPTQITHLLVTDTDQVMAIGCNEEVSGVFNPRCVRTCSVRDIEEWNTGFNTTARENIIPGDGRLVAGRMMGSTPVIWSDSGLHLGVYVGSLGQTWRFEQIDDGGGLIGPNAVVVDGQVAYWLAPDRQFRSYVLGGVPTIIPCPLRSKVNEGLAASQGDKIVASSCAQYGEVRFDYPSNADGAYENNAYLSLNVTGEDIGAWSAGVMARTAYVDAGPSQYPCGVTFEGQAFWHERGNSADGAAFSGFLESGDLYLSPDRTMLVRGIWPDFDGQLGAMSLTIYGRFKPQGDEVTYGPYMLSPGADRYDFRASGRLVRVRFDFNSSPVAGRWGKSVFDLQPTGMR